MGCPSCLSRDIGPCTSTMEQITDRCAFFHAKIIPYVESRVCCTLKYSLRWFLCSPADGSVRHGMRRDAMKMLPVCMSSLS